MTLLGEHGLQEYCLQTARQAHCAAEALVTLSAEAKNAWLRASAQALRAQADALLEANALDLEAAPGFGLSDAQADRLRLNPERIEGIARAMEEVALLPEPIGEVIESSVRPNGIELQKVRVPLGVVFFIYESRPNVTADAAALCVKSGNAVILRGGKEAAHSSRAIVDILRGVAEAHGIPVDAVQLVSVADREAVGHFLALSDWIDLAIPRGGEGLIRRVADEATMPVLKHFSGNCHLYVDAEADLQMAQAIVMNSKCQRMGVCNAAESLLVHAEVAPDFLPQIGEQLQQAGVEIRGDEQTCGLCPDAVAAREEDYAAEFLGPVISVRVVPSTEAAIKDINTYGSKHTDAIITNNAETAETFANQVDTAAVMINASTRFNDGGEFGLGAEIGISTDKFHARGPCGIKELTTYKYVARGNGQVRG
ncbi:MAG: glutamate-5-semialdehyde dehydrogenase [Pirellulales bacterium]|nr:glutamate-5-semialdehyde dehydrogenase [Pirellulales bacterium]